jgi:hypothetical protein
MTYSVPVYLGGTMAIKIGVTNQASLLAKVDRVEVTLDWYATYTGDVPQILQPGERYEWTFSDIPVPSSTWSGKHSFDILASVAFAGSSGGWSKDLTTTGRTDFGVQEAPPPPPATGMTIVFTQNTFSESSTDYGPMVAGVLIAVALVVVVILMIRKRAESPSPATSPVCPHCGADNPSTNEFCGKCGQKLAAQGS